MRSAMDLFVFEKSANLKHPNIHTFTSKGPLTINRTSEKPSFWVTIVLIFFGSDFLHIVVDVKGHWLKSYVEACTSF